MTLRAMSIGPYPAVTTTVTVPVDPTVPVLARFTSRAPNKVVPADQTPFYCDVSAEAVANAITRGAEGVSAASVVSYKWTLVSGQGSY